MPRQLERFTAETVRQEIGGRRAQAEDFGGEIFQGVERLGVVAQKATSHYVEQLEEDDARQRLVEIAKHRAKYAKRTDDALSNGEDLRKVEEDFQNELTDIRAGAVTKKGLAFVEQHGAVSTSSFQEQVRQIEARRYGASLTRSVESTLSSASEAIQRSPELLPFFRDGLDTLFKTFEGKGLPPDVLARAREQAEDRLLQAGGRAAIEQNPHAALDRLQQGDWEGMKPEHRAALIDKAQVDIRAREVHALQKEREQDKLQKATDNAALSKVLADWGNEKATDPRLIAKMETVSPQMREHIINTIARITKEPKEKPNHEYADSMRMRLYLPEGDPRRINDVEEINKAMLDGRITVKERGPLAAELAARERPGERAIAKLVNENKRQITGMDAFGMAPKNGWEAFSAFRAHVQSTIDDARAAGEPITPYVTPGNPKYLGNLVQMYAERAKERVARQAEDIRNEVTQTQRELADRTGGAAPPPTGNRAPAPAATPAPKPAAAPVKREFIPGLGVNLESGVPVYRVSGDADYDKLPPGTVFRGLDGVKRVKPQD